MSEHGADHTIFLTNSRNGCWPIAILLSFILKSYMIYRLRLIQFGIIILKDNVFLSIRRDCGIRAEAVIILPRGTNTTDYMADTIPTPYLFYWSSLLSFHKLTQANTRPPGIKEASAWIIPTSKCLNIPVDIYCYIILGSFNQSSIPNDNLFIKFLKLIWKKKIVIGSTSFWFLSF